MRLHVHQVGKIPGIVLSLTCKSVTKSTELKADESYMKMVK